MTQIDLDIYTGNGRVHNLTGKDKGLSARAHYRLDSLDAVNDVVEIIVPEHIDNISTSFFLGLFSKSVKKLGNEDFRKKYNFLTSRPTILNQVSHGIQLSLTIN